MEKQRAMSWFGRSRARRETASELYGTVVAAARKSWFYGACGVPDTPEGRFEMVALHLALLLNRLAAEDPEAKRLARTLTETFVSDMDACMREMGVGDLAVPKKVKKAAGALADRTRRYKSHPRRTIDETAAELTAVMPGLERADALADYVHSAARHLENLSPSALRDGGTSFPEPGTTGQ